MHFPARLTGIIATVQTRIESHGGSQDTLCGSLRWLLVLLNMLQSVRIAVTLSIFFKSRGSSTINRCYY